MYKVILIKFVWDSDSQESSTEWAMLSRIVELPFVPFPGLGVQLPMQRVWRLQSADWDVEEQLFRCRADDQTDLPGWCQIIRLGKILGLFFAC